MSPGTKLSDHTDEFNKLILDLTNIDIEIKDENHALVLLTSFPSSYENFVETLLFGRESLTIEDALATMNSKGLKKRTEGTKKETSDELYVRGKSNHSDSHLKRDCPMKKSSGFVKKGKSDHDFYFFDDEGNAYFGEAFVIVGNDEMTELVTDSGGSYHMTQMRDFLYEFLGFDGGSVQLSDNRTSTIKGIRKVKIQLHDRSSFILKDVSYVPGLRKSLILLVTLENSGSDLEEDDYNVYDYCSSEKSNTALVDHLSDDEEEVLVVRTKKRDPAPKKKVSKMFDESFFTSIFNGLPRDDFDDSSDPNNYDQDKLAYVYLPQHLAPSVGFGIPIYPKEGGMVDLKPMEEDFWERRQGT
nr:zinc finger, CCHC-type [Tanacetum cinerariifolium]